MNVPNSIMSLVQDPHCPYILNISDKSASGRGYIAHDALQYLLHKDHRCIHSRNRIYYDRSSDKTRCITTYTAIPFLDEPPGDEFNDSNDDLDYAYKENPYVPHRQVEYSETDIRNTVASPGGLSTVVSNRVLKELALLFPNVVYYYMYEDGCFTLCKWNATHRPKVSIFFDQP